MEVANYRPIALTSIFAKIIERIIFQTFYDFFEQENILVEQQYGFRQKRNINMAIHNFVESVITNMDKRLPTVGLFMDMTKAFDHVRHDILLDKLYCYGIRGIVHKLIRSFLSDREQITEIASLCYRTNHVKIHHSRPRSVKFGVPQGSVLGPLLFIIYINDLPKSTNLNMTLFADDSTVLCSEQNMPALALKINNSLKSIIEWMEINNLQINYKKCAYLNFKQRNQDETCDLEIHHKGNTIEENKVSRFLGLHVDQGMTWKVHVDHVCSKLNQSAYGLYALSDIAHLSTVMTSYHASVVSKLRYGIIFWGNSTNWPLVFKAQKRCIRSIFKLKQRDSCKPYFIKYKLLTLPCIYIFECAVFVKLNIGLYKKRQRARHADRLCVVPCKTTLMHKSVLCTPIHIFNKLPKHIRDISDIARFKKSLHKMLCSKCYYSLYEFQNDDSDSILA